MLPIIALLVIIILLVYFKPEYFTPGKPNSTYKRCVDSNIPGYAICRGYYLPIPSTPGHKVFNSLAQNVPALAKQCNSMSDCQGFNNYGNTEPAIEPESNWGRLLSQNPPMDTYVKV